MRDQWVGYVNAHVADKYRVIWTYGDPIIDGSDWVIPVRVDRVGLKFSDWSDRGRTIYTDSVSIARQRETGRIVFFIESREYDDQEIWHFSTDCAYFDSAGTLYFGPPDPADLCEDCEALHGSAPESVMRIP